ncbi:L,D-transpeptidase family protein [Flavobacterium branchiophilum]|uniref:L,D-transpeptidase family protein n=1 Tax=Flavobacterium branchiophilum TaxID=55197 RepID=UPI0037422439
MIMRNNSGNEVYRTVVKTIRTGGRVRNIGNSDTPQGNYNILGWRETGNKRYNSVSFGPNDLLALDYKGDEGGSRNGMHIHGGRQEGKYKGRKDLASTHGCMRINDDDIKVMKEIATGLENNDKTEKPGILSLTDDLSSPVN